jgi:hypothetical protein
MWLEETAWIWIPAACALAGWMTWRVATLTREVRGLRKRIEGLEGKTAALPMDDERRARSRAVA